MKTFGSYRFLLPCIIGLALARTGLIVATYGSYESTDEGIFTDGTMIITLLVYAVILLVIAVKKVRLPKKRINQIMRTCILLQSLALIALTVMSVVAPSDDRLRFILCTASSLVCGGTIYYWLRRVRGTTPTCAAVMVFSALFLSEILIYLCSLPSVTFAYVLGAALTLIQLPCMIWARSKIKACEFSEEEQPRQDSGYFGFARTLLSSKQFLIATAIGIGLLSLVIGFLRGYPDGSPIGFTTATRIGYMLLTMGLCVVIVVAMIRQRTQILTVGIWVILQTLAGLAVIFYVAFPHDLALGAAFATTLNALMVAFTWYVMIAFMSFGWRSPYYYTIAGDLVWLGSRCIARIALVAGFPLVQNDALVATLMGALIVVSGQVIMVQLLSIAKQESNEHREESSSKQKALQRLMGLDGAENLSDMRQATMQHNAEEIGHQFLLSDREIQVLSLYALGYTQKRVAEELYITPSTAHAHVKRIYAKTGFHSRQEILDYMQNYTS